MSRWHRLATVQHTECCMCGCSILPGAAYIDVTDGLGWIYCWVCMAQHDEDPRDD